MLEEFETMLDTQLGRINAAIHFVKLKPPNQHPIRSTPYCGGPKARDFKREKVRRMLRRKFHRTSSELMDFPNSFRPEERWLTPILRRLWKVECGNSERLVSVVTHVRECIDFLGDATVFSTLVVSIGYWQI